MNKQQLLFSKRQVRKFKKAVSTTVLVTLLSGTFFLASSCSSGDDSPLDVVDQIEDVIEDQVGGEVNVNSVKITVNETFGNIITDANGISLYFFSKDVKGNSECKDGCLAAWPIFYDADLTVGDGLEASNFDVITREDGTKQNTYRGWPLYYFASDSAVGDTNGDGVGDNWYIAKPNYSLMYAQTDVDDGGRFYMTNGTGRTIYRFTNDIIDTNNFTVEDFSNNATWPVITLTIDEIPSILDSDDFGTIDVFGTTQVTYKGNPLYYFGNDTERGDFNGESGVWPLVNVDTEEAPIAPIDGRQ